MKAKLTLKLNENSILRVKKIYFANRNLTFLNCGTENDSGSGQFMAFLNALEGRLCILITLAEAYFQDRLAL